jgi:hypothetical protein
MMDRYTPLSFSNLLKLGMSSAVPMCDLAIGKEKLAVCRALIYGSFLEAIGWAFGGSTSNEAHNQHINSDAHPGTATRFFGFGFIALCRYNWPHNHNLYFLRYI